MNILKILSFILFVVLFPTNSLGQVIDVSQPNRKLKISARRSGFTVRYVRDASEIRSSKTVYILKAKIDIPDKTFNLPDSCYIKFTKGTYLRCRHIEGRLLNDQLYAHQLGAIGDGLVDDRGAIQNAINISAGKILFRKGVYKVDGFLQINHSCSLVGENNVIVKFTPSDSPCPGIQIRKANNVLIERIHFSSDNMLPSGSPFVRSEESLWSNRYAVVASSIDSLIINECNFSDVEYAIKIDGGTGENKNVYISSCNIEGNVATPIYISHTSSLVITSCNIFASNLTSGYDHHIYGSASTRNHIISDCTFIGGVGIPIHYYTNSEEGAQDIIVERCSFVDTKGAILVSSSGEGKLIARDIVVNSERKYDNGVFRSGGKQSLMVTSASVYAPYQHLFSCSGASSVLCDLQAEVRGLAYNIPYRHDILQVLNCNIDILEMPYLLSVSKRDASLIGNIDFIGNKFSLAAYCDYLVAIRGRSIGVINIKDNEIYCIKGAKLAIQDYSIGLEFTENRLYGVSSISKQEQSVDSFSSNIIVKE